MIINTVLSNDMSDVVWPNKKTVLVCGSAGFIGGHLVRKLQNEGCLVVGADINKETYCNSDYFYLYDLTEFTACRQLFYGFKFDEVYNLACLMGGMGFIGDKKYSYDIMVKSSQIVINIIECCVRQGDVKLFFSSSACVYNEAYQMNIDNCSLSESMAYPAMPDLTYGWQKLFSEKLILAASDRIKVRIARFHNIFGIEGTWNGGKEKYPAAICRKVAETEDGGSIIIWGDGQQTRSFLNVDECLNVVEMLMNSDITEPINIGSDELISCNDLAKMVIEISGKDLKIEHDLTKPQGVRGRNSDNTLIKEKLGYAPSQNLKAEMTKLYNWVNNQVNK